MGGEWDEAKVGDVAILITKGTTPTSLGMNFTSSGIRYIKSQSICDDGRIDSSLFAFIDRETHQRLSRSILKAGDILFSMAGMYLGKTGIVEPEHLPANTNQAVGIIRLNQTRAIPRFVRYCLARPSTVNYIRSSVAQSAQPNINLRQIGELTIPLPPLPEQRAIAHILGTLDDKIELNRRMSETLEAMARALFKSWFVDFDPVRAEAEGRDTGLPKPLADLFPDRLVDSELGEIPEGWEVKSLDSIAHFQNGLALQKYRTTGSGGRLPVVKIAQLRSGSADSGEWATDEIKSECVIDDGDVVFSWSGSLLVKIWTGGRAALNQHLFKVTSDECPKWFFLHALLSHLPDFRQIAAGKATTMGHIKRHHLTEALCVVPDEYIFARADDFFSPIIERVTEAKLEARALAAFRDTLLPKLISGELRIKDAERFLGRVG